MLSLVRRPLGQQSGMRQAGAGLQTTFYTTCHCGPRVSILSHFSWQMYPELSFMGFEGDEPMGALAYGLESGVRGAGQWGVKWAILETGNEYTLRDLLVC